MIRFLCLLSAMAWVQEPTPAPAPARDEAKELFDKVEAKYSDLASFRGTCALHGPTKGVDAEEAFSGEGHFDFTLALATDRFSAMLEATLGKVEYQYGIEEQLGTMRTPQSVPPLFTETRGNPFIGPDADQVAARERLLRSSIVRMGFLPAFIVFPRRRFEPVKSPPEVEGLAFAPPEKGRKAALKILKYTLPEIGEGGARRGGSTHKVWINPDTLAIQKREIAFAGGLTLVETWEPDRPAKKGKPVPKK